jgi:hypothetical protein
MEEYIPPHFWPHEPILDAFLQENPYPPPLAAYGPDTSLNASSSPIETHGLQVPRAYKGAIFPFAQHPLGMDMLADFITAGGLRSKPTFAMAYRSDQGTPVNLIIAEKWPQLLMHRPLRANGTFLGNRQIRLDCISEVMGLCRPAAAPKFDSDIETIEDNGYPPHSILSRLQPGRFISSFGIIPSLAGLEIHETCRAAWPYQWIGDISPLERWRRALFNLYGVKGFAKLARDTTGAKHTHANEFLD